ncbi:MAG: hypothetical protein EOS38_06395 [Mesorhizobium sp.]|nr:hypothetical protein EOA38_02485 [Mesorhizobium sp. M1E.F.Ca.ET.041.01.1.1]RWD88880.1 MAG: hypothetical protein EOS39_22570 [Mesorhizobium sp.]RWD90674.1 MAG: hypothetical protein EOS38_06395 [Mesorhizobium sp.]TIV54647.1 MAG: hypothetical protein E5V88_04690 [Mesorhizobium sp.]
MHVAQKCGAVLGKRHASKQRTHVAQSVQRFWENDMHRNKDLKRVDRIRFDATRLARRRRDGKV